MKLALYWLRNALARFVLLWFPDRNQNPRQENQSLEMSDGTQRLAVGRLYYSIPGKCYTGYIVKGRILKSGARCVNIVYDHLKSPVSDEDKS